MVSTKCTYFSIYFFLFTIRQTKPTYAATVNQGKLFLHVSCADSGYDKCPLFGSIFFWLISIVPRKIWHFESNNKNVSYPEFAQLTYKKEFLLWIRANMFWVAQWSLYFVHQSMYMYTEMRLLSSSSNAGNIGLRNFDRL